LNDWLKVKPFAFNGFVKEAKRIVVSKNKFRKRLFPNPAQIYKRFGEREGSVIFIFGSQQVLLAQLI